MDAPSLFDMEPFHDAEAAKRDLAIYCFDNEVEVVWVFAQNDEQAWDLFRRRRHTAGAPAGDGDPVMRFVPPSEPITVPHQDPSLREAWVWLLEADGPGFWFGEAKDRAA